MLKKVVCKGAVLCFVPCLLLCVSLAGCTYFTAQKDGQTNESQRKNQTNMNNE